MEGLPIRNARRGDIPSLILLWTAMLAENERLDGRLAIHPRAKEYMASQFSAWLHDNDRILVVAEENGRVPVGYAAARVAPGTGWHKPLRIGEITDCFVVAPRRRRGIARRMVGRLMDLLYEKDTDTVRCRVVAANPASLAFWQSMGWEILEEILEREAD